MVRSGKGSVFISIFNFGEIGFTIYRDYIVFSLYAPSFEKEGEKTMEVTVSTEQEILARDDVSSLQVSIRLKNPLNFKRIEKFKENALVIEYTGIVNVRLRKEEAYHHEVVRIFIEGSD